MCGPTALIGVGVGFTALVSYNIYNFIKAAEMELSRRASRRTFNRGNTFWEVDMHEDTCDDDVFYENFRMGRGTFKWICKNIADDLKMDEKRTTLQLLNASFSAHHLLATFQEEEIRYQSKNRLPSLFGVLRLEIVLELLERSFLLEQPLLITYFTK